MFQVAWNWLIKSLLFFFIRRPKFIAWMDSLSKPIVTNHGWFLAFRQDILYKVQFTGQIIYLEHILNDKFDPINRAIFIDNVADSNVTMIFYKVEGKPKRFFYYKWNAAANYAVGDFAVEGDKVYKAVQANTGFTPSQNVGAGIWAIHTVRPSLKYKSESSAFDFIVMVPSSLVFNHAAMSALVNYYKLLGKKYTIQTY